MIATGKTVIKVPLWSGNNKKQTFKSLIIRLEGLLFIVDVLINTAATYGLFSMKSYLAAVFKSLVALVDLLIETS